jgi:hypothetical protein
MSVDIEEALSALQLTLAGVTAIAGQNVFPNRIPQRVEMPALITRRISGGPINGLSSALAVRKAVFQVEAWSQASQEQARQLDLAAQALNGLRGTSGAWFIQKLLVNPDTDQDNPQIPVHADDLGSFCSFHELTVFYKPSGA